MKEIGFSEKIIIYGIAAIFCVIGFHKPETYAARLAVSLPLGASSRKANYTANPSLIHPELTSKRNTSTEIVPTTINQPEGIDERIPNHILREILYLDDRLKCFPKLLCTIYQDKEITRQGFFVNSTELALAYIKLIKAVNYKAPATTTTTEAPKRKRPIIQIFKIPMGLITASTYQGRKDHLHRSPLLDEDSLSYYPYNLRSRLPYDSDDQGDTDGYFPYLGRLEEDDDDDDKDSRAYLREKLKISEMMQDLKDEDSEMMSKEEMPSSGGLATTLLSSFLPFVGSSKSVNRDKRSVDFAKQLESWKDLGSHRRSTRKSGRGRKKPQDPFWKAVNMWRQLKKRSQCESMYETCPFESWEIVRMLDLVRGQSQVLSTYLKITVDNVKPKRRIQ